MNILPANINIADAGRAHNIAGNEEIHHVGEGNNNHELQNLRPQQEQAPAPRENTATRMRHDAENLRERAHTLIRDAIAQREEEIQRATPQRNPPSAENRDPGVQQERIAVLRAEVRRLEEAQEGFDAGAVEPEAVNDANDDVGNVIGEARGHLAEARGMNEAANVWEARKNETLNTLHGYFHLALGDREAENPLNDLIQGRAERLTDMGEEAGDVAEVMKKGKFLDLLSAFAGGSISAISLGSPGFYAGKVTKGISDRTMGGDAAKEAIGAAFALASQAALVNTVSNATDDSLWLAADNENMSPELRDYVSRKLTTEKVKNVFLGPLSFSARDLINIGVGASNNNMGKNIAQLILTSLIGGGVGGMAMNSISALSGPEILLGRQDWEQRYNALKDNSLSQWGKSAGNRAWSFLGGHINLPALFIRGLKNEFSLEQISQTVILGAGMATIKALSHLARDKMSGDPADINHRLIDKSVNLAAYAAYVAQGAAGLAGKYVDEQIMNTDFFRAVDERILQPTEQFARRSDGLFRTRNWNDPADNGNGQENADNNPVAGANGNNNQPVPVPADQPAVEQDNPEEQH